MSARKQTNIAAMMNRGFDEVVVERAEKFGGDLKFGSYKELEKAFVGKEVHPLDLKNSCARYINELLEPVRKHFESDERARGLLESVRGFEVTR